MNSEGKTVDPNGSKDKEDFNRNLGLILGQLGLLTHLPEKIERMNREIGEIKITLNSISVDTNQNTKDIRENSEYRNKHTGAEEENKVHVSFLFSVLSLLVSVVILITSIWTGFFSS
jgi:hypothetical protein